MRAPRSGPKKKEKKKKKKLYEPNTEFELIICTQVVCEKWKWKEGVGDVESGREDGRAWWCRL